MGLVHTIRKYLGGGLGDMGDTNIPKARVEIYLRSQDGETFYVPTLYEGLLHLLSNEGYRLSVYEWPDGAGFERDRFAITVYRSGNELSVKLGAPMITEFDKEAREVALNRIIWDFSERPPAAERGKVEVVYLGLPEQELSIEDLTTEVEVTIDGK